MKPLIVLLAVFFICLFATKFFTGKYKPKLSGRISLSAMLLFTAIGHFAFTEGMVLMLPPFVPFKTEVIYLTGIFEICAAAGLFIRGIRTLTAYLLILFFILALPANIYGAISQVDYQEANFNGPGIMYLWFRVPLQLVYIIWTYFAITQKHKRRRLQSSII